MVERAGVEEQERSSGCNNDPFSRLERQEKSELRLGISYNSEWRIAGEMR